MSNGKPVLVIGSTHRLTERKRLEYEMHKYETVIIDSTKTMGEYAEITNEEYQGLNKFKTTKERLESIKSNRKKRY